jgi:hypothetical protein
MGFRRAGKRTAEDVDAVPAAADPLVGHPLQAALVERDRGSRAVARVEQSRVGTASTTNAALARSASSHAPSPRSR